MVVFKRMIGIMSQLFDESSVTFARALDKVGLAASISSSQRNLEWALLVLKEALHLRLLHLGPHHCDTVDSLNNIAGVFLRMKSWTEAKEAYVDVLTGVFHYSFFPLYFFIITHYQLVRAAIFGPSHPSVAVTGKVGILLFINSKLGGVTVFIVFLSYSLKTHLIFGLSSNSR